MPSSPDFKSCWDRSLKSWSSVPSPVIVTRKPSRPLFCCTIGSSGSTSPERWIPISVACRSAETSVSVAVAVVDERVRHNARGGPLLEEAAHEALERPLVDRVPLGAYDDEFVDVVLVGREVLEVRPLRALRLGLPTQMAVRGQVAGQQHGNQSERNRDGRRPSPDSAPRVPAAGTREPFRQPHDSRIRARGETAWVGADGAPTRAAAVLRRSSLARGRFRLRCGQC